LIIVPLKGWNSSNIFGNNLNKSKFYAGRNYEKIEVRECYHAMKNLLSNSLLFKNLKIEVYRTIIVPAALYGCETWSLRLGEELRLRVFENKAMRRIFGTKADEVTGVEKTT
jgi:hypothetical protein